MIFKNIIENGKYKDRFYFVGEHFNSFTDFPYLLEGYVALGEDGDKVKLNEIICPCQIVRLGKHNIFGDIVGFDLREEDQIISKADAVRLCRSIIDQLGC